MAKLKNTAEDETQNTEVKEETPASTPKEKQKEQEKQEELASVVPLKKTAAKNGMTEHEPDAQVTAILKVNYKYQELYVDKQGSVYTIDTLPNIRKNAILYKNPFYKPLYM